MTNWGEKALDELGYVSRGRSRHRPRDAAHLYGGDYPFIQTGDVKHSNLYITGYSQTYNEAGLEQSRLWKAGTLCITIAANIADTSILSFDACFPDSVMGFVADEDKADTRFVKYLFDAFLQKRFQQFTQGAAQDNLSQEKLLSLKFPVPDVKTQCRIADILSAYDDFIENNRRRIELLEQSARLLYKEWFVSLHFPGHEHVKVVDGVPQGWKKKTAFDAMEIMSGGTPSTQVPNYWNGDIPFYTPKDYSDAPYAFKTERSITESGLANCNSHLYPKNTVFISARGTVGKIIMAQKPMAMSQTSYALSGKNGSKQFFLFSALQASLQQFLQRATGAVFTAIVVDTFKTIPFILPPQLLIDNFEETVTPIFAQIENLLLTIERLEQARNLLLPRLMNGEIPI